MFLLPKNSWEVRTTPHGRGVFTKKEILPGAIIGDYLGLVVRDADQEKITDNEHFYSMYYTDDLSIEPTGTTPGIHLINHSCTPNTWMYTYHGHTLYFALRYIFPKEELTVSYQISPVDDDCNPCEHLCTCGSLMCKGTMHLSKEQYDKWLELEEKEAVATPHEPSTPGEILPRLSHYPALIPDHPIYTLFGSPKEAPLLNKARSLPNLDEIRQLIRDTGRMVDLPLINMRVLGVMNECVVSLPLR